MQQVFSSERTRRTLILSLLVSLALPASAQNSQQPAAGETLTLTEALRSARTRNGDIRAAFLDVEAAKQGVIQSRAPFLPTITPTYTWQSSRRQIGGSNFLNDDGDQAGISLRWQLLDAGERGFSLRASEEGARAQEARSLQTLRSILFTVHQRYFDTLRSQELLRVATSQRERAQKILEQTQVRVQVGDAPRIQTLQAEADVANAQVQELQARNSFTNATASLRAVIGWEPGRPMPLLASMEVPATTTVNVAPLQELVQQGLANRADLRALRRSVSSQPFGARRADRESQVSFSVDANFDQELHPDTLESRTLSLTLSLPWLDGGRSRAAARQARLNYEASRSELRQAEVDATAEIEAVHTVLTQNSQRVQAAQTALNAARTNYEAAVESQRLGASDIIEVITAQVSLVTAESNYVEALFDFQISETQLRLVTGQSIPGEQA